MDLKEHIRSIPDFPKPGILFYDISTLLRHAAAWKATVDMLAERIAVYEPDLLVGIESRGFLVAGPVAYALGCGSTMVRKPRKLPGQTISHSYELEYGTDTLEIQSDGAGRTRKWSFSTIFSRREEPSPRRLRCCGAWTPTFRRRPVSSNSIFSMAGRVSIFPSRLSSIIRPDR